MMARFTWIPQAVSVLMLLMLLMISALIWAAVIVPVMEWRSDRFSTHKGAITKIERMSTSVAGLKQDLAQLSEQEELGLIWSSREIGEVTARVQAAVSTMARDTGISLRSVTPSKATEFSFVKTVGFRLEGEARLDQLVMFLRTLEGSSPALVVERAQLRRLNRVNDSMEQPAVFLQLELMAPVRVDAEDGE